MTLGASTMSVMADDTTPYTYKVTLSAGNKGTINGQNKIEQTNIASGSTVTFNLNDIQVTDDKYYVSESVSADVTITKHLRLLPLPLIKMPTM